MMPHSETWSRRLIGTRNTASTFVLGAMGTVAALWVLFTSYREPLDSRDDLRLLRM